MTWLPEEQPVYRSALNLGLEQRSHEWFDSGRDPAHRCAEERNVVTQHDPRHTR
jgi:hypothetical protein